MNTVWLIAAVVSFIIFLIFMILPVSKRIEIEMHFEPDWIEDIPIVWIWVIRILSLVLTIVFASLYLV